MPRGVYDRSKIKARKTAESQSGTEAPVKKRTYTRRAQQAQTGAARREDHTNEIMFLESYISNLVSISNSISAATGPATNPFTSKIWSEVNTSFEVMADLRNKSFPSPSGGGSQKVVSSPPQRDDQDEEFEDTQSQPRQSPVPFNPASGYSAQ